MDIEKICRTCLSLNGPLLSIYDNANSGTGCLADMIKEFTKIKPHCNDMLPAKVCLTCISEINHCYSFKMKCENSNKTLRQLIPNAQDWYPNESSLLKADICNKATQTKQITYVTNSIQTIQQMLPNTTEHKEVQTSEVNIIMDAGDEFLNLESCKTEKWIKESDTGSALTISKSVKRLRLQNDDFHTQKSYILLETTTTEADVEIEAETLAIRELNPDKSVSNNTVDSDNVTSTCHHFEYVEEENDQESQSDPRIRQNVDYVYPESIESVESLNEETRFQLIANNEECYHGNKINNGESEMEIIEEAELIETNDDNNIVKLKPSVNNKKEHKCPHCCMTFVSTKFLRRHISARHDNESNSTETTVQKEDQFVCTDKLVKEDVKPKSQSYSQALTEHAKLIECSQPQERNSCSSSADDADLSNQKYYCEYCKAGFMWRKTLTMHMKQNVCRSDNYKCDICKRIFISKENLEAHISTHSKENACLECKQICANVEDLAEHMIKVHNRKARNQCSICKKVFTMKTSLIDHLRIHSGEKPFLCTVCGKRFRQNSNLRQHIMRHTNEKKFKCDLCQNAYVTKAELFSHKRTHTGDHPFKCDVCNTRFTSSSSLQKHRRKHTGERPYACEFCPMRFTALNILKNHRRTHTGEKPYKCEFCDRRFTQKGDCQMHQSTHENKRFLCLTCGARFSKASNLRQHVRRLHNQITKKDKKKKEVDKETTIQITIMENAYGDEMEGNEGNERLTDTPDINKTEQIIPPSEVALPSNDSTVHTNEDIMSMACLLI